MPTDAALLAGVPFFQYLDDQERLVLAQQLDAVEFSAGQIVFEVDDPGGTLFVVRRGKVEVYCKDDTGERIVLETAGPGDVFGEISFIDGGARSASVLVIEDLEALAVDRDDLEHLFRLHPEAGLDVITAMGARLRRTVQLLRHTASRNVNAEVEDRRTGIERAADWIAAFSGSITFLMLHVAFFAAWILLNTNWLPGWHPPMFDRYPFGLLTMVVSLEAIILSVFVLLSQNRQVAKDRIRGDVEYEINLKAELEVAHLHEKVDRLHAEALTHLAEIRRTVGKQAG
jgi:CRP/FNR family cyclic AMP-dependent transcriptional regulator